MSFNVAAERFREAIPGESDAHECTVYSRGTISGGSDAQECTVHSRKSISEINDAQECTVHSREMISGENVAQECTVHSRGTTSEICRLGHSGLKGLSAGVMGEDGLLPGGGVDVGVDLGGGDLLVA